MAKSGHSFPSSAGFSNSTGKTQNVKGYSRSIPKKAVGGVMRPPLGVTSGPKLPPQTRPMVPNVGMRGPPVLPMGRPGLGRPPGRGALAFAKGGKVPPFKPGLSPNPPKGPRTMPGYASGGHVQQPAMKTDVIGDQGNSVVKRGKPFITEADVDYGGSGPLRTGYKKGGKIKGAAAIAKKVVAKHVAAPAPKGHKGFNKLPMFGKK